MIQGITRTNSSFLEGAGTSGCLQKLKSLIASINAAVVRFFRYICPCFCRKTGASATTVTRTSQVNPRIAQMMERVQQQPQQQQSVAENDSDIASRRPIQGDQATVPVAPPLNV